MNEFEDDLIADALKGRAGGGDLGIDGALAAVNRRAHATRRRRAAVAGTGAMSAIVAVAALAFVGNSPDVVRTPNDSIPPSEPVSTETVLDPDSPSTTAPPPTSTDGEPTSPSTEHSTSSVPTPVTTSVTGGDGTTPPPSSPGASSPATSTPPPVTSPTTGPTTTTAPVTTEPETTEPETTEPENTEPENTEPETTEPETTEPETTEPETTEPDEGGGDSTAPFSGRVYTSTGGSITVSWNGSSLSLGGTNAAAGYTSSIEDQRSDRIRVSFGGADDWRIDVRADDHGVVTTSISS